MFWWNLLTNGLLDVQTVHGGCPVVVGSKWITNKWIRWKHQQMKLPCAHHRYGGVRQQPLGNKMCDAAVNRCDMENEILYNNQMYYENLKQFSPEFM